VLMHRLSEDEAGQGENTPAPVEPVAVALPWPGPILAAPVASWPREQPAYPAPVRVEPMRADGVREPQPADLAVHTPSNAPASHQEATAPHSCPSCGAPLTRGAWLAAKRWGRCAACKAEGEG
jgi:hypothetical protein